MLPSLGLCVWALAKLFILSSEKIQSAWDYFTADKELSGLFLLSPKILLAAEYSFIFEVFAIKLHSFLVFYLEKILCLVVLWFLFVCLVDLEFRE